MLTAKAEFDILPGKEDEAIAAIKSLVAAVEEKEPGNVLYRWHRNLKEPTKIMVFELWADQAAVDEHRGMEHMKVFGKLFGTVFDPASVKIERYELIGEVKR